MNQHEQPTGSRSDESPFVPAETTVTGDSFPVAHSSDTAGRYRVLHFHARGGLGEVMRACDEELNREVALKRIQQRHANDDSAQRRFLREAEITARLEHPGVVPVHGLVRDSAGLPCYAMRFIQGESLREAIQTFHTADSPIRDPRERAVAFRHLLTRFIAVCNTVAYAHSKAVVHRDLKPANVMLGAFNETLVVDWGLAKQLKTAEVVNEPAPENASESSDSTAVDPEDTGSTASADAGTRMGEAAGTPSYMSPEQAAGRWDVVGPASDVYGLGATLYHLLAGVAPIKEKELSSALDRVKRGDFPPPRQVKRDVPAALDAVCRKAMSLKPEDRYSSPLELAAEVERWLADEPVSAWREPLSVRVRRWVGRNRTLVTASASALLVAVVALGVGMGLLYRANRATNYARIQAEDNERLADTRREEAQQSLLTALSVIDRFSSRVANDPRFRNRDLEETRRDLLLAAIASCRTLMEGKEDDPELQTKLIRIQEHLAQLYRHLGEYDRAVTLYTEALSAVEKLLEERAEDLELRGLKGSIFADLGVLYEEKGDIPQAEKHLRQAETLLVPVVARAGATHEERSALARARMDLGKLLDGRGDHRAAEPLLADAHESWKKLAAEQPRALVYRLEQGSCLLSLSTVYDSTGRALQCGQSLQDAVQLFRALVAEEPSWPQYRFFLGIGVAALGKYLSPTAAGIAHYREAIPMLSELARRNPALVAYHEKLAVVCHEGSEAYLSVGDLSSSETTALLGVESLDALQKRRPDAARWRELRAKSLTSLGNARRYQGKLKEAEPPLLDALALTKKLVSEDDNNREYQYLLGWIHNNLGLVYRHGDRNADARKHHREALAVRERLVKLDPKKSAYRANLASTCTNLANLLTRVGPKEAEQLFLRSIELQKVIVRERPEVDQHALDFAMSYNNLGSLYRETGRPDEVAPMWARSLAIREDLVKRRPKRPIYLADVMLSHYNLAVLQIQRQETKKAEASLQKSIEAGEKLVEAKLANADTMARLGQACQMQARLIWQRERKEDGPNRCAHGLKLLAEWDRKKPAELPPPVRDALLLLHHHRAGMLTSLGSHTEAHAHWLRTMALTEGQPQTNDVSRLNLARCHALIGKHHLASNEASLIASEVEGTAEFTLMLVRIHALALAGAMKDEKLSKARREGLIQVYGSRAVGLLEEMKEKGHFGMARMRRMLREEADLEALRKVADSKKLLDELGNDKKKE